MKLKNIKRRFKNRFLPLYTKNQGNKLSCIPFFWKLRLISLLFLIVLSCYANGDNRKLDSIAKIQVNSIKFKTIEDADQRTLDWLINSIIISSKSPQKAKVLLTKGQGLWSNNYPYKKAILLLNQAEIDNLNNKQETAYEKALKAIQLIQTQQSSSIIEKQIHSIAYATYGKYAMYTKEREEGLNYCFKALELANDIAFSEGIALAQNQIGLIIYYGKKDYNLALSHLIKAEEMLPKLNPPLKGLLKSFVLSNIALMWTKMGELEKSIKYKLKILNSKETKNNLELTLITNNNIGADYYSLKQYDLAEQYLQATLSLMETNNHTKNKGIPLLRMGLVQLEKGDLTKANYFADAIDFWLIDHQFISDHQVIFYQFKSKIAKAQNDFEQAIFWLEKAAMEQEALDSLINSKSLLQLEEQNKFKEIKNELDLLEKERVEYQETINTQNRVLFVISLLLLVLLIFGLKNYLQRTTSSIDAPIQNELSPTQKKKDADVYIDEVLKQSIVTALVKGQTLSFSRFNTQKVCRPSTI